MQNLSRIAKKTISVFMATILVLSCFSSAFGVVASAADDIGVPWDGTTVTQPSQASDGYYLISNGAELAWFRNQIVSNNNRYINGRLTANINLNSKVWEPIGNHDRQYGGTFDGQGFTVSNVYVTSTSVDRALFGKITTSGVIKNLNVNSVTIVNSRDYSAGLLGVAAGGTISNCHVTGISITAGRNNTGGLVGMCEGTATITDCSVTGTSFMKTIVGNSNVAGLVGYIKANDVLISGCTVRNVNVSSSVSESRIAGIVGYSDNRFKIYDCLVDSVNITGARFLGGIAFISRYGSIIERCGVVNSNITSTQTSASTDVEIGGLIGVVPGDTVNTVQYCYVYNTKVSTYGRMSGGFIGKIESTRHIITENYSAATLELKASPTRAGTLIGYVNSAEIQDIRYVSNPSQTPIAEQVSSAIVNNVVGITDTEAKNGTLLNFLNGFTNIWQEGEDGYPVVDRTLAVPPSTDGSGYYLISSGFQLEWFQKFVNSGNPNASAKLIADINLGGKKMDSIGNNNVRYNGTFDGQGFTISNLYINKTGNDKGLFGSTNAAAVIKNFRLVNAFVNTNGSYVGAIVGVLRGSVSDITIEGVYVSAASSVGGVIGHCETNATYNNITVIGTPDAKQVRATGNYVGGIVGNVKGAMNFNNLTVDGIDIAANERAGGLVGDSDGGSVQISNSLVQNVNITVNNYAGGVIFSIRNGSSVTDSTVRNVRITGGAELGGISGTSNGNPATVSGCLIENFTSVSTGERTGGIIGYINNRAYITDTIIRDSSITGYRYIGGVSYTLKDGSFISRVGVINVTITATNTNASTELCVGGLIGLVGWSTVNTVQYNYASNVTLTGVGRMIGGLIGKMDTTAHKVAENYADATINNSTRIYAGSFLGYRSAGAVTNNFARENGYPRTGGASAGASGDVSGITEVSLADIRNGTLTEMLNDITDLWAQINDDYVNGFPVIANAEPPALVNGYYEIKNTFQLEWFRNLVNDGNVTANAKLIADINIRNKEWTPIGTDSRRFNGTFDGNNHTISNLRIIADTYDRGLFGSTNPNTVIKNLKLNNVSLNSTSEYVGAVVGLLRGRVENVTVEGINLVAKAQVGGIAGQLESNASIKDCFVIGTPGANQIRTTGAYTGGLIGNIKTTSNITNVGASNLNIIASERAGGISGDTDSGTALFDTVTVENVNITVSRYAGGVVFGLRNGSSMTNASSKNVSITGAEELGGLVGCTSGNEVRLTKSSVENYTGTSTSERTGGIIGYINNRAILSDLIVKDSSITGLRGIGGVASYLKDGSNVTKVGVVNLTIASTNTDTGADQNTGGLFGIVGWSTANTIQYCYVTDTTVKSAGRMTGGFIGKIDTVNHNVLENYANADVITTSGVYAGSFIGYRTSGSLSNNFSRATSMPLVGSATSGVAGDTAGITAVGLQDVRNGNLTEMLNNVTDIWAQHNDDFVNGYPEIGNAEPPELVNGYYEIGTSFQLEWFKNYVNAGNTNVNGKLIADINLRNKSWEPIGNNSRRYTGIFDGQGHTVKNVYVETTSVDRGLFGKLGQNGVLKNLTVENVTIPTNYNCTGGIVGVLNNASIINCHVRGINISNAGVYTGGIVGLTEGTVTVTGSSVTGTEGMKTLRGSSDIGGIVGRNANGNVTFTDNTVDNLDIIATSNDSRAAGFTGDNEDTFFAYNNLVKNCNITGGRFLGGFTFISRYNSIFECNGVVNTKVTSNYNSATTDIEIGAFAGVIAGTPAARIQFNYVVDSEITTYGRMSGGFIGKVDDARHLISENYSDTAVNIIGSPTRAGTAFGWLDDGAISSIFYLPVEGRNAVGEATATPLISNITPIEKAEVRNGSLLNRLNNITPLWEEGAEGYPVPNATLVSPPETDAQGYYLIYNSYQYEWITRYVNAGNPNTNIRLMADINLNGKNLDPIGSHANQYAGTFDGQNFTISNLYINKTGNDQGLTGSTTSTAVIRNLKLRNVYVSSNGSYVGAIVGVLRGSVSDITIEGVYVSAASSVGGVIGHCETNATYNNITVIGTPDAKQVRATGNYVGGIVGNVKGAMNFNNLTVDGIDIAANERAGGLVGDSDGGSVQISNSLVQNVNITVNNYAGGVIFSIRNGSSVTDSTVRNVRITGGAELGGISGTSNGNPATVSGCLIENFTSVSTGERTGGIIGYINNRAYITDTIIRDSSITGYRYIGGVSYTLKDGSVISRVGVVNVDINATLNNPSSDHQVGGLVGLVGWGTVNTVRYNYVSNVNINVPGRMVGGLFGRIDTAAHDIGYNYVNETSVSAGTINVGSLVGSRTSGNFTNNFAINSSALPLVGSGTAGAAGDTNGTAKASVFEGDIESAATQELLDYYISASGFVKSFENENVAFLKDDILSELYDEIVSILSAIEAELAKRLDAEIQVLRDFYDEYGMICIFNYELIGSYFGSVTTAIAEKVSLPPETQANYDFYLWLIGEYNEFMANYGYNSFYEASVGFMPRVVREDDIARYESPRDDYPVTYEKMQNVVNKLDALLLSEDFATLTGMETSISQSIKDLLAEELYTSEMINELMSATYPKLIEELESAIEENAEIDIGITTITFRGKARSIVDDLLRKFGLSVYPSYLADIIDPRYETVRSVLYSAGKDWKKVNFEDPEAPNYLDWGEMDKDIFIDAFANSLKGIYPVLRSALTANSFNDRKSTDFAANIDVSVRIQIDAVDSYDRAIVPLLEMLNITGFIPSTEFNEITNVKGYVENIFNPLLTWIENEIPTAPFSNLMELLPNIAYSLEFGLVEFWLKTIKTTIRYDIDGVFDYWLGDVDFDITSGDYRLDVYEILSEEEDDIFYGADLSNLSGLFRMITNELDIDIELPPINNKYLASLGSVVYLNSATRQQTRGYIHGDSAKVAYVMLKYIFSILSDEELVREIIAAFDDDEEGEDRLDGAIGEIIRNISENPYDAIAAIAELCNPAEYPVRTLDYGKELEGSFAKVQYSQYWTKQQADFVADNLDNYIDSILKLLGLKPAGEILRDKVGELYSNETLTSIVTGIRGFLEDMDEDDKILKVLDVDISPWDEIDVGHDWGFVDGDKEGFLASLCAALSPLNNAIGLFLADMDYTIMDGEITVKGYNGYKNAVVPLLEALGCDYEDILTGDEYLAAVAENPNSMIEHIIRPIFELLERVYAAPTETLFSILPNLIYFLDSGVLDTALLNMAQPVLVVIDTIRPIYGIDIDFSAKEFILEAISELAFDNGITLPAFDISSMLKAYAEPKLNVHGEEIYVINAANEDVMTVMLRYLALTLFGPENIELVKNTFVEESGLSGDNAAVLKAVIDSFGNTINTENGPDKVLGNLYILFKGTESGFGGAADFLQNFNKYWTQMLNMLADSDSEFIRSFAETVKNILNDYLGGVIDEGGLASGGIVRFFQKIAEFFRRIFEMIRTLFA